MSPESMILQFSQLPSLQQARLLCSLGGRLTVTARDVHVPMEAGEDSRRKAAAYNQIMHKIFGQVGHLLENSEQRFPDEVLIRSISAVADENGLMRELEIAWKSALHFVLRSN